MRLPGYSDFELVAQGGEGTVYRARQIGLDRYVAVKVINVDDPARRARFQRELEITVRLGRQHPHIVTVIDTGAAPDGRPCIVMEYYDLGSLYDRLRAEGPLPVADVVAAGIAVADALAFAHGQGFLHRDVKPQNILVLPTSFVLADFGVARMADAGNTTSLQMVSYRHAAPQMIDGQSPAAVDDLWSLGSTLFTLLDGAAPFSSDNPDEDTLLSYVGRVRSAEPRPLRRPDVPPELVAVIAKCLSKAREDRYPDAGALKAALTSVSAQPAPPVRAPLAAVDTGATTRLPNELTTDLGSAEPLTMPAGYQYQPPPEPGKPPRKSRRGLVLAALALLVGGAVGVTFVVLNGRDQGRPASVPTAQQPATQQPSSQPTSTQPTGTQPTGAQPTGTQPTGVQGSNPAFAPTLDPLDVRGATIKLSWSDPTGGRAQFVIVDVTTSPSKALATVPAGVTTYTTQGLDPQAKQYCFQVLGIGLDDPATQRGISAKTCTTR
jgi:serine/threonine protein kinase